MCSIVFFLVNNLAAQVFDIEVDEGLTLKCGYNYGQNPYEVASSYVVRFYGIVIFIFLLLAR